MEGPGKTLGLFLYTKYKALRKNIARDRMRRQFKRELDKSG